MNKPVSEPTRIDLEGAVAPLDADPDWHPTALRWFESLARSGQSVFYEPSDWASAWVLADSMSRELNPQPMVVGSGESAHMEMVSLPPKAASIAAWIKGMGALLATEGDRRRVSLELTRQAPEGEGTNVEHLADARLRLAGSQ